MSYDNFFPDDDVPSAAAPNNLVKRTTVCVGLVFKYTNERNKLRAQPEAVVSVWLHSFSAFSPAAFNEYDDDSAVTTRSTCVRAGLPERAQPLSISLSLVRCVFVRRILHCFYRRRLRKVRHKSQRFLWLRWKCVMKIPAGT